MFTSYIILTSELIKPKGQFLNEQNLRQGLFFRTLLIFFRLVEGKHQKYTLVFILLHFTYLSLKISITTRLLRPFFSCTESSTYTELSSCIWGFFYYLVVSIF